MKTNRKKKLTIASLTALALCVAPLATRAQEKPAENRGDKSYSSPSATPAATADVPATTTSDFAIKAPAVNQTGATLRAAAKDVEKQSAKKLAGNHVRGTDAKDLGKIDDFLVDSRSGEVAFAIVSSGGIAGVGDKLRLVPFAALKPTAKNDEFSVGVDQAAWDQVPVVKDDEFENGTFTLTADLRNQQAARFNAATSAVGAPAVVAADTTASLVRAGDLAGRELHSAGQDIGKIEVVIIDRDTLSATALLDPKKDFANTSQKFLVPFSSLQIAGPNREPITTTLTRAEFDNVTAATATTANATDQVSATTTPVATDSTIAETTPSEVPTSSAAVAATTELNRDLTASGATEAKPADPIRADASTEASTSSTPKDTVASDTTIPESASIGSSTESAKTAEMKDKVATTDSSAATSTTDASASTSTPDQNLTPTGKTSADQVPAGTDAVLATTARSIREAFDNDAALSKLDVRITPENGKLVLRGSVKDATVKSTVELKAREKADGREIDNQITVSSK